MRPLGVAPLKGNFHVLVMFLYTYQTLTDSEIKEYIQFANSERGVAYHKATLAGFEKAMVHANLRWGERR